MADDLGLKYASYLSSFRDYQEQNSLSAIMNGYGVINGVDSFATMDPDFYELALNVFSCIDHDTKLGKRFFAARNPAVLCAAFLVNDCQEIKTNKIKANNIAFLAQYLYLFDKEHFENSLKLLANDSLLSTIIAELPDQFSYQHACSVVIKKAKNSDVDLNDREALFDFWTSESNNIKNNPEQYTFTKDARKNLVSHAFKSYKEGNGGNEISRF
jgi:hypothetical protein